MPQDRQFILCLKRAQTQAGPCLLWHLEQGDIIGNFEFDLGKEAAILRAWSPRLKAKTLILIPV